MDYAKWKFVLDIVLIFANASIAVYVWWTNREKVTAKRFEQLEKEVRNRATNGELKQSEETAKAALAAAVTSRDSKCVTHQRETKTLEQAFNNLHLEVSKLPDRSEMKDLTTSMQTLTKEIGKLDGRIDGINRAVDIVNEFLIEQGGKN